MTLIESSSLNTPQNRTLKRALLLLPLVAISMPSYGESFTAKRAGQGFTGITQDFTSSLSNPALLTKFDDDDDVFFSLNLGIMGSDQADVLSTTEDISDALDDLVDDIDNIQYQNFQSLDEATAYNDDLDQQVDDIVEDFESISGEVVKIRNGLNLQILIPNQYLSLGLFTNQYARIGGSMEYVDTDKDVLDKGVAEGNLDLNDLDSSLFGVGYSISEAGIMAAYPVINHANYDMSIGTKVKYQRIDLYYNNISMNDLDDDDFDAGDDQYITDESSTNIDLGFYTSFGEDRQWQVALVTNNLMGQSVTHLDQNITFNLDTTAIIGLSYQNDWVSLATELDLIERSQFATLEASKYASLGAEFRFYEHIQFRLGYRTDLNDIDDDIVTAGIGISPWDVFAIDVAAFTGDNDTLGAALQLSLKL